MEKTIEVRGHKATIGGKTIWVPPSQRHIEIDLDDEFGKTVAHLVKQGVAIPEAAPKPEPLRPAKALVDPFADLEDDFQKTYATLALGGHLVMPAPETEKVPDPKPAPAAGPWQPEPEDVVNVQVVHNTEGTSDKVYKVSVLKFPDGTFGVVAQWGKNGGPFAQQVKQTGMSTQGTAQAAANHLVAAKMQKGYYIASPSVAFSAKFQQIVPLGGVIQEPVSAAKLDPEGPKEGDVKGALTFHKGRWHATKEPEPPAPVKLTNAELAWEAMPTILANLGTDQSTFLPNGIKVRTTIPGGEKLVVVRTKQDGGQISEGTWTSIGTLHVGGIKNESVIAVPKGSATALVNFLKQENATPNPLAQAASAQPKTNYNGITAFKKAGDTASYGGKVTATYAMDGLKPSIRLNLPHYGGLAAIPAELGAKWMPIAKVWQITLKGTVGAGGKEKAAAVHNWLTGTFGAAGEQRPAQSANPSGLAPGGPTPWISLQVGMKLVGSTTKLGYDVTDLTASKVTLMKKSTGHLHSVTKDVWDEEAYLQPGILVPTKVQQTTVAAPLGPKVGDTKVENGKTYRLNENHKWELVEEPAKPKLPAAFPFKQVGPQGGAQPGGQFVDEFGQKWYIKFPQSEDHCKNEVLALKFYRLILGKDAVPQVKTVVAKGLGAMAKDGQIGIASKWVEGISKDPEHLAKGAAGVFEGFGTDAWLANWDVAGSNQSQYLNLMKTKEGGSIRVDAGGALIHTGLGALKSQTQFGDVVTEIDRLRDPSVNKETAFIFKGMTQAQMIASVVKVLEVPDDIIQKTVEKFGPGNDAARKALADKLIARKQYLAKRFPEADKIANPPPPDKHHLKVDPAHLPPMLDYFTMGKQGPTGKWVSQSEVINKANNAAAQSIYDAALKGDYLTLKDLKAPTINKTTGEVEAMVPIAEHKSAQYLVPFYNQIMEHMEVLAYPAAAKAKAWVVEDDVEDIHGLSNAFPAHAFGVTVADVPANERLGFWIQLGKVDQPERFMPPQITNVTTAQKAAGKADYQKFSSSLTTWLSHVQGSGSSNIGDKKSHVSTHKSIAKEAYDKATEFSEGSHIRRWLVMPQDMIQQFVQADPGLVFENPRSQCCSTNPDWEGDGTGFGSGPHGVFLDLVYAKGAKGMATFASGSFHSEQEITSLPGQRYMLMSKGKASNGKMKLTLLVLPPDPTYVEAFKKVA